MEVPQKAPIPIPKKSCMITLMFACANDEEALAVKAEIDKATAGIKEKRYSFQIDER